MKCMLYEEGVFNRVKTILEKENSDDYLACAAVLQNISEHRFLKGIPSSNFLWLLLLFKNYIFISPYIFFIIFFIKNK